MSRTVGSKNKRVVRKVAVVQEVAVAPTAISPHLSDARPPREILSPFGEASLRRKATWGFADMNNLRFHEARVVELMCHWRQDRPMNGDLADLRMAGQLIQHMIDLVGE